MQTALHWAAKHGNEDVVKLIAGTRKADVNAKTVTNHKQTKKTFLNSQFVTNDFSLFYTLSMYVPTIIESTKTQNGVSKPNKFNIEISIGFM